MKICNYPTPFIHLVMLLSVLIGNSAFAWTNGQDASFVVGQTDFFSNGAGCSQTTMDDTYSVAVGLSHGKMYVVDGFNHRLLRFPYPIVENGVSADLVFGAATFDTSASGSTRNTFTNPRVVTVDSDGRLWVSENSTHRFFWFNQAYAISANQPDADGVLGQDDFVTQRNWAE